MLQVNRFYPVTYARSISHARGLFFSEESDLVLINAPLHDEFGENLASDICEKSNSSCILMVSSDIYDEVYLKISESGVIVIPKPLTREHLSRVLDLACATKERMNRLIKKQATVEEKIEEIRLVTHAKWILIEKEHMTESEAHRYIEKRSMDERTPRREIATEIIRRYEE